MNPRLDRALRIASGVLGLLVAVPVLLAVLFLIVLAWVRNEAVVWILVPPLVLLGAALTILGVRALRPKAATVRSLASLGALELAVVVFLLAASRPITSGTILGAVISFVAAAVAFWAAFRAYVTRNDVAPSDPSPRPRAGPISITVRKPAGSTPGAQPKTGKTPSSAAKTPSRARSKRRK